MAVTDWKFPTSTFSNSGVVNPDNAWASDDAHANLDTVTDQVIYGNFGDFGLPAGAVIQGIELKLKEKLQEKESTTLLMSM